MATNLNPNRRGDPGSGLPALIVLPNMKPIYKVLLCIVFGLAAFVGGGMFVSPVKHIKGKEGYVIPTDGTREDPSRIEPDHMADFTAELPFYIGSLASISLLGYAGITTIRSIRDHRPKTRERQSAARS